MQQQIPIDLIKGDKTSVQSDYLDALPENMYAIARPMFGAAGYMLQHPGLTEYGTGVGPDRGGVWNERLSNQFRVSYSQFIIVNADGSNQRFGNIPGMDQVSMPYSFNTQAVVGAGGFWLYDPVNGFRPVVDPDLKVPIDGCWIDGYYFLTDGEYLYHTTLANEDQIDPLAYATAEMSPDPTLGVGKTADNKVIVFNRYTTEFFANAASTNFAFTRIPGRAINAGAVATRAKCSLNDNWYFVGGRKEASLGVHMVGVGTVRPVSTRSIERILDQYKESELSDVSMEARVEDGYSFFYIHLPNETLMFNETIAASSGIDQAWTIVKRGVNGLPWRGINGVFDPRLGKWVYGDKADLRLGILDPLVTTQYGEMAEWVLYTPFMYLEDMSIDSLNIETVPGESGSPSDEPATMFLSLTYDGRTWGKEWTEVYGAPGNRNIRYIVNRLGYVRNWVGFKLRGVSRARMAFARGYLEIG